MPQVAEVRTPDQIIARIEEHRQMPFDFQAEILIGFLDFGYAKTYLKEGVEESEWASISAPLTREAVIEQMKNYWDFAVGKALDHRGLSANRSVDKMRAWVWLIGEDDEINWNNYANYGAPILTQIGERYGFLIPKNTAFVRMALGQSCHDECMEGCGA
jgi:hypothetical protein